MSNRRRRGRSEGSIFQRIDGSWVASISAGYRPDGRRRRLEAYCQTKAEAQEKLAELRAQAGNDQAEESGKLTLQTFLVRWLATAESKTSPGTYKRYEAHCRLEIIPRLGNIRLAKLSALHVEQLYSGMAKDGTSAAMRRKVGTCLGTALRHACRLRLIGHNPVADVPRPKSARIEIHPLDPDRAARFLEAAKPDRLFALYVLALDSGMRQGELFGLHWPDVDFAAGSVQVRRSLEELAGKVRLKEVKTARSRRRVELSAFTLGALNAHRQAMLAEGRDVKAGPVFVAAEGGFLHKSNLLHRSFEPILDRAKLPRIRFHDLRHTCATLLLMAGENAKVVSERLGHSGVTITLDTYSHVLPSMGKRAAETMDKILRQPAQKAGS